MTANTTRSAVPISPGSSVARNGLEATKKYDIRIVDTAGRHALEGDLIQEMKDIHAVVNAEQKLLVMVEEVVTELELKIMPI